MNPFRCPISAISFAWHSAWVSYYSAAQRHLTKTNRLHTEDGTTVFGHLVHHLDRKEAARTRIT